MAKEDFPIKKLQNFFAIASPVGSAPQVVTKDLTSALTKMREFEAPEHITFFNFDGGLRDLFVGNAQASSDLSCPAKASNCVDIQTETMKNV